MSSRPVLPLKVITLALELKPTGKFGAELVDVLRQKPDSAQRVVLIDFPGEGMKTLGFVMRTFSDSRTGEELAAVYVPTALNPTSGFLEIVPAAKLIASDIPTDEIPRQKKHAS